MECKHCGKVLVGQQEVFCSTACRNKFYVTSDMLEAKIPKTCVVCGKKFLAFRKNARFCSRGCIEKNHHKRRYVKSPQVGRAQGPQWKKRRRDVFDAHGGVCWLCEKPLIGRYQVHHLDYGDRAVQSQRVVPLHGSCHLSIHRVTVCVAEDGTLSFHGKALDLIKEKHMKGKGT